MWKDTEYFKNKGGEEQFIDELLMIYACRIY